MLTSLHIENIAIIRVSDLSFGDGFTALTGETGAGKSIIIDAIGLLCGSRADRSVIRTGCDGALVSGFFCDIPAECSAMLAEAGVTVTDGELMLSRTLGTDGRSVCRVNGRQVPLSIYREAAGQLINIHGQQDNWQLLREACHCSLLDRFAANGDALAEYGAAFSEFTEARSALIRQKKDARHDLEEAEMLAFRLSDIGGAKLREGEEEKLLSERSMLRNAEKLEKQTSFAYRALSGGERANAAYVIDRAMSAIRTLDDVSPEFGELAARLEAVKCEVEDVAAHIRRLGGSGTDDPTERLNRIESRLDRIDRLKKKYRTDLPGLIRLAEETKERLDRLECAEDEEKELEKRLADARNAALASAAKLTATRLASAKTLADRICGELAFLDMPNVRFVVSVEPHIADTAVNGDSGNKDASDGAVADGAGLTATGQDEVRFLISAASGDEPRPLSKIASGGELSRVMLAIKSVFLHADGVPTIIYDEIDAGVSGRTARKIGIKLRETAASAQVLCVTHSAQIASLADTHLCASKALCDGKYESAVTTLDREGRIEELSRILGGISVTDAQRKAAEDLLNEIPDSLKRVLK